MKIDKRFVKFFNLFNVTEEDAISHYTATTEISETNDDEDENGAGSNNNNGNGNSKKRTKIRTNPHVVKGCGTLEKKAKNRQKRQKSVASSSDIDQQSTKSSEFDTEVEIEPNDIVDDDYDQVAENSLEDSFEKGAKKPPVKSPSSEKLPKNSRHSVEISLFLCEIIFWDSRSAQMAILTHLEALNFDIYEFLQFLKGEIYQINKTQSH